MRLTLPLINFFLPKAFNKLNAFAYKKHMNRNAKETPMPTTTQLANLSRPTRNGKKTRVFDKMPAGWRILEGATNLPSGYKWICNGKSRFGGEYEHGMLKG